MDRILNRDKPTSNLRQLQLWSVHWQWQERTRAWNEEVDRQGRAAQLEAIRKMRERHIQEAIKLQERAIARLIAMDPAELSPADVLRFIVEGVKLERLSRGEPETIQEHQSARHDDRDLVDAREELLLRIDRIAARLRQSDER